MKKKVIIASSIFAVVAILATICIVKLVFIVKVNDNIKLGNRYYKEGRYRESVIVFEDVVKKDKKNLDGRIDLFNGYIAIEDKGKGEKLLLDTIGIMPKEKEPYIYLAKYYAEGKRYKDALSILKKGCENTENSSLNLLLNRCTSEQGNMPAILGDALSVTIGGKLILLIASPVIEFPLNGKTYNKFDMKVTWNQIPDANNYFVCVRDITTGKKIINDINIKKDTNYNIASSNFTMGHRYCISVGVKYTNGDERWNEDTCVVIDNNTTKTSK